MQSRPTESRMRECASEFRLLINWRTIMVKPETTEFLMSINKKIDELENLYEKVRRTVDEITASLKKAPTNKPILKASAAFQVAPR